MTDDTTTAAPTETIPLWLAVAITVLVSMPFGLWLGTYNFTLWCAFIVWGQYFALGATPSVVKTIIPSYSYAVALTALTLWAVPLFSFLPNLVTEGDLALSAALFVGIAATVYTMKYAKVFQEGSLPFFNGISMGLAVFFTGTFPAMGGLPAELAAGLWAIVMGLFGCVLGVFNVWITFPRTKQ